MSPSALGVSWPPLARGPRSLFPSLLLNLTYSPTIPRSQPRSWGQEVMRSHSVSASPFQHPQSCTRLKTQGSPEPSPEAAADGSAVPPLELHTQDPTHRTLGSPGPWLVLSKERLSMGPRGPSGGAACPGVGSQKAKA